MYRETIKKKGKRSSVANAGRFFICGLALIFTTYAYIDKQNQLTEIRRIIPKLEKEVRKITEENRTLQYEIEKFENPLQLMELSQKPEFSHLRFPMNNEVIVIDSPEDKSE